MLNLSTYILKFFAMINWLANKSLT